MAAEQIAGKNNSSVVQRVRRAGTTGEPPLATRFPNKLAYLKHYAINMAYVPTTEKDKPHKTVTRRLYGTLRTMVIAERGAREIRVIQLGPTINWPRVWQNLHNAWIREQLKSAWFTVIHEIIPKNERMAAVQLTDTGRCSQCGWPVALQHRPTECNEGTAIWNWKLAQIS
jgi:hypothetical protein